MQIYIEKSNKLKLAANAYDGRGRSSETETVSLLRLEKPNETQAMHKQYDSVRPER
jgi:hypothetical protein